MRKLTIILAVLLVGCVTMASRQKYVENHPDLRPLVKDAILRGSIVTGMTKEQVRASWGEPDDVNRTVYKDDVSEQWIYGDVIYGADYLYFDNGELTSWQD